MTHKYPDLWAFSEKLWAMRRQGKRDTISQTTNGVMSNYLGKIGEYEFGKMFGLDVDLSLTPKNDGGIDFTMADGRTVDVKTRIYDEKKRDLFIDIYDRDGITQSPIADLYVAMYVRMPEEQPLIGGYITGHDVRKAACREMNGKMTYYVPFVMLRPLDELRAVYLKGGKE